MCGFLGDWADFLFWVWVGDNPRWTLNYLEQMFSLYFTTKLTKVNQHRQKCYTAWSQRVKMSLIEMDFFFQDGCCRPSAFTKWPGEEHQPGRRVLAGISGLQKWASAYANVTVTLSAIFLQCKMDFDSKFSTKWGFLSPAFIEALGLFNSGVKLKPWMQIMLPSTAQWASRQMAARHVWGARRWSSEGPSRRKRQALGFQPGLWCVWLRSQGNPSPRLLPIH